ncbi:hypothetical protein [Candidatus Mycoplasma mahonii]|uniref:hypothetical protein n=1 Tax=Candidatus Mycoplasma mahonii TaxID=3004105 RepID=UPI0026ED2FE1|nr:hypothetical protein [Candidatus Mycoplasma mahonii]WKX02345.1 hypothetical protein O3I44_02985 [Candidatus Mycoplasma mahonii]
MSKRIKIAVCGGIGAIVTTSIAVPLLMINNGDSIYITPGKRLVDAKIIESREYDTFKETFQDLKLGLTNINVTDMNDDGDNLVLTATGVLPRATVSTHASFIVQSATAIQANPNTIIKAIFNVVKTTGEVTLLKLLKSGSKESEAVIKAAITKNEVLNTTAMEQPTARMTDRITNPNNPFLLSSTLIFAIKALDSDTALQGLLNPNEIVSNLPDIDIFNELIKVLPEGTIGKNEMLLKDIEITKNDITGVLKVIVINANKSFIVSNFLVALSSEDISSRVTAFESYFDSLQVTTFNEGVTADNDKAIYDQIKTDGVYSINASSNINEMNSLFNAEGDVGSLKDGADEGLVIYNVAIALANKKANDQRHLNTEQLRVNSLSSNGANAKIADAEAQGNFDDNAQTKYGITLGSATEGAFTYTYDATAKTITITAVLIGGAGDLTIPLPTPIGLSPTPAENTEIETAANLLAAKTTAKGFIRTAFETAPSQDNAAHNAKLFGAIALAKTAADSAIDEALDETAVNALASSETVGSEVDKVLVAITKYKESTGEKAIADALAITKITAKGFIRTAFETAPSQDNVAHNAKLFGAIALAKTAADRAINDAPNEAAVNALASSETDGIEVDKVLVAISEYENSTGEKAIADALAITKTTAKGFIRTAFETAPSQDDKAHNAELFAAIANAKAAADVAIDGALNEATVNVLASSAIAGSEVLKVLAAIKEYEDSTGTDKALADAKTKAKEFIATAFATAPSQDDKAHNAELFAAIANAKAAADVAIDGALNEAAVNVLASSAIVGSEVDKVLAAINAYKESTGTDKALADAKTASRNAFTDYFNALTITSLNTDVIPLNATTAYEKIKIDGLSSIDNALSIEDVEALFSTTNTGSLKTAADAGLETYNAAIENANIDHDASLLTEAKNASSKAFITYFDTLATTILDDDVIEPLAAKAAYENIKTDGLSSIDSALSIEDVNNLFNGTTNIGSLKTAADNGLIIYNDAIENANIDHGAKLLTEAQTKAKGFIATSFATAPEQDDNAHDAKLFGAITSAKTAADHAIDEALDEAAVNALAASPTDGLEVLKVLAAIREYENSTGTIALLNVNLAKFRRNVNSSKSRQTFKDDVSGLSFYRNINVDVLGITTPIDLSPGIRVKYRLSAKDNRKAYSSADVLVTLTKGTETVEKTIIVTARG